MRRYKLSVAVVCALMLVSLVGVTAAMAGRNLFPFSINDNNEERHSIFYESNGGKGRLSLRYDSGEKVIILDASEVRISRDGYTFVDWNTKADGSGDSYKAGDRALMGRDLKLYAQWESGTK